MYQSVLDFWFEEIEASQWWTKDDKFDALISDRFGELHTRALNCELFAWRQSAEGRLAEIIVLDQFSRNIYRDTPQSFAHDAQALALAQEAVAAKADQQLTAVQNSFLYMPYMHSESLLIHDIAVELFRNNGIDDNLQFEIRHRNIIEQFGRYPHRNEILGRKSTEQELEFLQTPGSSF